MELDKLTQKSREVIQSAQGIAAQYGHTEVDAEHLLSALLTFGMLVFLGRQIGFTLSLAGIAGFIVSLGVAADSFVIYFERLKDEIREGRSPRSAVPRAWVRAECRSNDPRLEAVSGLPSLVASRRPYTRSARRSIRRSAVQRQPDLDRRSPARRGPHVEVSPGTLDA